MFQLDFYSAPTEVRIFRCGYVSQCKARDCPMRATPIAEKVDGAGRHCRQVELCGPPLRSRHRARAGAWT